MSDPRPRLGLDVYCVRSQGWSALEFLGFCAAHGIEVAHFSCIEFLGGTDRANLDRIRAHARARDLELEVGIGSICETSSSYRADDGPADRQLTAALDVAEILGSPIIRCFLGSSEDREGSAAGVPLAPQSAVPLDRHIENVIASCRAVAGRARDLGIKIAIENHVGDLHSSELARLIEAAGSDYVGAVLDTGNATWTLETPAAALETLGRHVVASHIRDSAVWEVPEGLAVQWCPLGAGNVGIRDVPDRLRAVAPEAAFTLEILNRPTPRVFATRDPAFWSAYRTIPAWTYASLVEMARAGAPISAEPFGELTEAERELVDVEAGIRFAHDALGLGRAPNHAGEP